MYRRIFGATMWAIAVVLALASCDTNNPVVPIPVSQLKPATPPPVSPYGPATTVALGETATGTVHGSDPACKELDGGYYYPSSVPCQRFVVNVPQPGALTVRLEWGSADTMLGLSGRVAPFGKLAQLQCCSSPLVQTYQALAAGPLLIFVAWTANQSGSNLNTSGSQDFTLTTSFDPFANLQHAPAK